MVSQPKMFTYIQSYEFMIRGCVFISGGRGQYGHEVQDRICYASSELIVVSYNYLEAFNFVKPS